MSQDHQIQHPVQTQAEVQRLSYTLDAGFGERARIGLVVLQTDQTLETEFRDLTHLPGVSCYHTRIPNEATTNEDTLTAMAADLPSAAALLPQDMNLTALGYGCTSAATLIGAAQVAGMLNQAHPNIPTSEPLSAAIAALKTMGVQRLGLLTPYVPEVTVAMQQAFIQAGIEVRLVGSFCEGDDLRVGKIDQASVLSAVQAIGSRDDIDGVFISCTSVRAVALIAAAEATLGKPVTSSNHALAWHLLRLAGIQDTRSDKGRLFTLPLLQA